jgi:hypothetical protein
MKGATLITLYTIAADVVVAKIGDIARDRNQEPRLYLEKLGPVSRHSPRMLRNRSGGHWIAAMKM